ncbi:hypothetical protein LTR53_000828, partial [Teratosphaeriaceae sp. CCFEE 6253]
TFNIAGLPSERKLSGGGRKLSNPQRASIVGAPNPLQSHPPQAVPPGVRTPNEQQRSSLPRLQTTPPNALPLRQRGAPPPPLADPRAQWELDAETARLKAQADAEAREEQRRRRDREKADEMEAKRLQKQMEDEDRQARRKQAEVDRETERLKKKYGVQPVPQRFDAAPPSHQPNVSSNRQWQGPYMQPIPQRTQVSLAPPRLGSNGLYVQQPAASSSALVMSGANGNASSLNVSKPIKQKKSFFGLRSASDDAQAEGSRLRKKGSAMW